LIKNKFIVVSPYLMTSSGRIWC